MTRLVRNIQSRDQFTDGLSPVWTVGYRNSPVSEMEYCASAASMLAEEIWQIAEGFVEVPVNLLVQLKKCGKNIPND